MSNEHYEYHTSSLQKWPANYVALFAYVAPFIFAFVPLIG